MTKPTIWTKKTVDLVGILHYYADIGFITGDEYYILLDYAFNQYGGEITNYAFVSNMFDGDTIEDDIDSDDEVNRPLLIKFSQRFTLDFPDVKLLEINVS